jgi:uncharacterized protein
MIKREITKHFKKVLKEYPVSLLIGPRQSGKTTLVRSILANYSYVNLEDLENREFALNDPKGFLNQFKGGLIIDEVQRAPHLLSQIQIIVDENKKNGQFVLTGSQNFLLFERASQSLAGRVAILELLPLSLAELEQNSGLDKIDLWDLVFKGFYPKLHDQQMDTSLYYSNYIRTYVEKDLRLIKNISNLHTFKKFLNLCAGRCGQILNYSSLANDAGIDQKTCKEWLSILEASFIVFLLKPYYKNFNKRLIKMPKMYFYDTGLLSTLLGIRDKKDLNSHYLKGGIFESFIIAEFLKRRYNQGLEPNLYYFRDKTGNEIDLLLDTNKGLIPIEIKSGQTINADYFKGLKYSQKVFTNKLLRSYIVYAGQNRQKRTAIDIIPWQNIINLPT